MANNDIENLKTFMDGKFDLLNNRIDTMCRKIEEHHGDLYGKDSNTPGVKIKVDRLEQSKKVSDMFTYTMFVSMIGLFVKTIWEFFTGNKGG